MGGWCCAHPRPLLHLAGPLSVGKALRLVVTTFTREGIGEFIMRRSLVLLAASLLSAPALAAERNFPVGDFTEVTLSGSPDVEVVTGVAPSVVASGDPADLDRLDIRVEAGRLMIGTKPGSWSWRSREGVGIRVGARALSGAAISGSGNMRVDRLRGDVTGRISGSGSLALADVQATTLTLAISGSGDLQAAGRCTTGNFSVTGSGDLDASRLTCRTLTARVTGSGDLGAVATETADLAATGSGDIVVTGGARCTTRSTGSSNISCR
jgi:hypothetical protein